MREDLGVAESGLQRVVHGAFALLDLITFFTVGERQARRSRGTSARAHRMARGRRDPLATSRRASCAPRSIGWDALIDAGGYSRARERGTLRIEGRDYVMTDGDVLTVKFTP